LPGVPKFTTKIIPSPSGFPLVSSITISLHAVIRGSNLRVRAAGEYSCRPMRMVGQVQREVAGGKEKGEVRYPPVSISPTKRARIDSESSGGGRETEMMTLASSSSVHQHASQAQARRASHCQSPAVQDHVQASALGLRDLPIESLPVTLKTILQPIPYPSHTPHYHNPDTEI